MKLIKPVAKNLEIFKDATKKQRNIFHGRLNITLFLVQWNVAVRGHREDIFLSKRVQNEFIYTLSDHIRYKFIVNINKLIYYVVIFDSTPDSRRTNQMNQITELVVLEDGIVGVQKSFSGSYLMSGKTEKDMSTDILQLLEKWLVTALRRTQVTSSLNEEYSENQRSQLKKSLWKS